MYGQFDIDDIINAISTIYNCNHMLLQQVFRCLYLNGGHRSKISFAHVNLLQSPYIPRQYVQYVKSCLSFANQLEFLSLCILIWFCIQMAIKKKIKTFTLIEERIVHSSSAF